MERNVVYVDANGTKYYEAKKNEFNLQVIRAVAMDMGIVADRFLSATEKLLDASDDNPSKEEVAFINACMISAEILEEAMGCAEDVYDYLLFAISSVKNKNKTEAYYDDSNLKQSIRDLADMFSILDGFKSIKDNKDIKLPEWITILSRAYKHALVWQRFYEAK